MEDMVAREDAVRVMEDMRRGRAYACGSLCGRVREGIRARSRHGINSRQGE